MNVISPVCRWGKFGKDCIACRKGSGNRGLILWAESLEHDFSEQLLGLDTITLKAWGKLYAKHEAHGFNMDVMDSLIAATALVHHLTVVTRNTPDFPTDVKTKNPWKG